MSLKTTPVSVPLGGGLQESKHEWRVRPPAALTVQNVSLREGEALTKRAGFEQVTSIISGQASEVLIPHANAVACLNEGGCHVVSGNQVVSQDFGGHIPTEVSAHNLLPFRGAVTGPQIAYNATSDLFGLVLTESDPELGTVACMVVVDSAWEIVAGPQRSASIAHHTRVEPLGTGFAFFGVTDINLVIPDDGGANVIVEELTLRYIPWSSGSGFGSATVLSTAIPTIYGTPDDFKVVYDTCPGPADHSAICIVYREQVAGNTDTYIHVVTDSLTDSRLSVATNPGVDSNDAIWYDELTDTIVIYDGANNALVTTSLDLATFTAAYAHPSSPLGDYPVFYMSGNSVTLNGRIVTFSGGSPRVVAFGGGVDYTPVLHRRPQPRGTLGSYYVVDYEKVAEPGSGVAVVVGVSNGLVGSERLVGGKAHLIADEGASTTLDGGVTDGRWVVPLGIDRLPIWRMSHFSSRYAAAELDGDIVAWANVGVVGQTVLVDGALFIPQLLANAAYLPPPFRTEDQAQMLDTIPNFQGAQYREGGSSVNEGTEQLVVTEVRRITPNYSALDYYGSTLTAAGGLSMFDGRENFPATLDVPKTATIVETTGSLPSGSYANNSNQLYLVNGDKLDLKGVLVHIDRNGIKYRSDAFDLGTIENASGGPLYYGLEFQLEITEYMTSLALSQQRLTLEVYTNEIYTTTAGEDFNFMFRGGVYWDGTNYTVDATTIISPDNPVGSTNGWNFNPTPIYTAAGELGNRIPPASNVMAQAGNYIFLLSAEDPYDIRFSKPLDDRIGPEFNPLLSLEAPPESGGAVSLAGESDRLLLLCKAGVWELFVGGQGPDGAGAGAFPPFRKVWGGEGCLTHRGTVSGPFGTFFVADSGPKIVGRDGSVVDIARDLGLTDYSGIRRAVYDSANQEVWLFLTDSAYIFDLTVGAWTSSTAEAKAAVMRNRELWRLRSSDLALLKLDPDVAYDGSNTAPLLAKYVSPWLAFDNPMSYKRIRRVGALVQLLDGTRGSIRVSIAYDYVDANVDSKTWTLAELDGLAKPTQLILKPTRQKADAIRVTVEDVTELVEAGQGTSFQNDLEWSLVDISLEVAAKDGLIKLQQEAKK